MVFDILAPINTRDQLQSLFSVFNKHLMQVLVVDEQTCEICMQQGLEQNYEST